MCYCKAVTPPERRPAEPFGDLMRCYCVTECIPCRMKTPENGNLLRVLSVTECVTHGLWVLQGVKASFSPMPELCNRMMSSKCAFSLVCVGIAPSELNHFGIIRKN